MNTIERFDRYVIPNYTRYPVTLVRGEGSYIWSDEGKRYIDFFPGWGCDMLGHCPPKVVKAIQDQLEKLVHVPNSWYMEQQGIWAEMLSERSFGGKAFFCNSGAEANEAAIKFIRLHQVPKGRYKIITFEGSFHGRTLATTTATAQAKYQAGLGPLVPGFMYAKFGDLDSVRELVDEETAAIFIEPIQGEGGIRIPPEGFLQGLRQICDENDLLLHFDEVQTGCGRTGYWFAYQKFGVTPDSMSLAKAISGGAAAGAFLARADIAHDLKRGMHASTFGGNPIAAAGGIAAIQMIEEEHLLENAKKIENYFRQRAEQMQQKCSLIKDIRCAGTMIGIELNVEGAFAVKECMERGLLINCTHNVVIRMLPAINLTMDQAKEGLDILEDVIVNHQV